MTSILNRVGKSHHHLSSFRSETKTKNNQKGVERLALCSFSFKPFPSCSRQNSLLSLRSKTSKQQKKARKQTQKSIGSSIVKSTRSRSCLKRESVPVSLLLGPWKPHCPKGLVPKVVAKGRVCFESKRNGWVAWILWKPCGAAPPQESCGQCMYGPKQASEQSSRIGVQFEVNS